jgi:vacuolar-type H+-ATPase subunit I/STV1
MKYGINITKETLTTLAKIAGVVDDSLEDGKIKIAEGVKIATTAAGLLKLVKKLKELKNELKDLDLAERTELIEHFEKEFDLRNDKAEQTVEALMRLALNLVDTLDVIRGRKEPEGSALANRVVTNQEVTNIQIT